MSGGGVRTILLLPLVARCLEMYLYVYGNVCCVADVVKESVFSLGVLKYVVCCMFV